MRLQVLPDDIDNEVIVQDRFYIVGFLALDGQRTPPFAVRSRKDVDGIVSKMSDEQKKSLRVVCYGELSLRDYIDVTEVKNGIEG